MDEIDWAAERTESFNHMALRAVLSRMDGPPSSGVCNSCGDSIEEERLKANPSAKLCHECASEAEEDLRRARLCGPR